MLSAGEIPQPLPHNAAPVVNGSCSRVPMSHSNDSSAWSGKTGSDHAPAPAPAPAPASEQKPRHIWVVTGPAGSGKSTVGEFVQKKLGLPLLEGDDYHPKRNKEKMSNGTPLNDEDRWDWLTSLRDGAVQSIRPSEGTHCHDFPNGVVVACSALKRKYRDVIRVAAYGSCSLKIHFIYLKLDEKSLVRRLNERKAHYMKSGMIYSQLQALEELHPLEWDALTVDADASPEVVEERVLKMVTDELAKYR